MLGYFIRAAMVPVHVVEEKPKTSVFLVGVLLVAALATRGLTVNPFQAAPQPVPIVSITANQWVYQPGDQVTLNVTVAPPGVSSDIIWVFLEQPNNVSNYFQMLPNTGGIVNITLAMDAPPGAWTAAAVWNPTPGNTTQSSYSGVATTTFTVTAYPVPEFAASSLVMILAFATLLPVLLRRKATAHQNHPSTNT
jgi:hypothetical protein